MTAGAAPAAGALVTGPLGTGPLGTGPLGTGPLVVGLGAAGRGDDAVGPLVARRVAALALPRVAVVEHHEPTALLHLWAGHDVVVVVDAVRSAAVPPGTLHRMVVAAGEPALPSSSWSATGRGGTHAFGLGTAVELARALHRLPARLVVVGVEAASFGHGEPLSPAVEAALPGLVDAVVEEVRSHVPG